MRRALTAVLLTCSGAAFSASAQPSINLHFQLEQPYLTPRPRVELPPSRPALTAGRTENFIASVTNLGTDAEQVEVLYTITGDATVESAIGAGTLTCQVTSPQSFRCATPRLESRERQEARVVLLAGEAGELVSIAATVGTVPPGTASPSNGRVFSDRIRSSTSVIIDGEPGDELLPDGTVPVVYTVTNEASSGKPATNVEVEIDLDRSMRFYRVDGVACSFAEQPRPTLFCRLPDIAVGDSFSFTVFAIPPEPQGRYGHFAGVRWDHPVLALRAVADGSDFLVYRPIEVTTTADAGPGSLRAAIDEVNAGICPCRVAFRIPPPVPEHGWFTIAPISPLPRIAARSAEQVAASMRRVVIDGSRQTAFTGETNERGPEIELTGAGTIGNGLAGESLLVRGLAVNGFSENGLLFDGFGSALDNFIGTDPTGEVAIPNGSRGIHANRAVMVMRNLISGNGRSALFLWSASRSTIADNRLGISATGKPLGNGASGIYLGPQVEQVTIERNTIAWNAHFGIALAGSSHSNVIRENSLHDNGLYPVDVGLDGVTPNASLDEILFGYAKRPIVEDARYDAASEVTNIRLRLDETSRPNAPFTSGSVTVTITVQLFATAVLNPSGFAEPERLLATVVVDGSEAAIAVPGDLRGQYVTAIAERHTNYYLIHEESVTSEVSLGLQVE